MNSATGVAAVRSVEFAVRDLERSTAFYRDAFALSPAGELDGVRYFRATGPDAYVLALREHDTPGISSVELDGGDPAHVDLLHERVKGHATILTPPAQLGTPGGGYGFAFRDERSRHWCISAGVRQHAGAAPSPDAPYKVSHVVLNSTDARADVTFAIDVLGFRLRDETRGMYFLGCNRDHHSLAFTKVGNLALNHVAFELASIDAVMRGAGRMKRSGSPIQWGIGRHGPGANVFSYYLDPDDIPIEYTTEIQQIDDATYTPGTPLDWERPPFWDAWGLSEPPSQQFQDASGGLTHGTNDPTRRSTSWRAA